MSNKNDIDDMYITMIFGGAALSGIVTGSFGVAFLVVVGLGVGVCSGAIRF